MMDIANFIHRVLEAREDAAAIAKIREEVHAFSRKFPLPFLALALESRARFSPSRVSVAV